MMSVSPTELGWTLYKIFFMICVKSVFDMILTLKGCLLSGNHIFRNFLINLFFNLIFKSGTHMVLVLHITAIWVVHLYSTLYTKKK